MIARIRRAFPSFAPALREALNEGYGRAELLRDLWAGLSVGVIALPLSLALAIASGVPPQQGLYTAAVAGALAALCGGSRYNVTGPTAAFVAILHPIAVSHGLAGLLVATLMAGAIMVAMGWGRFGQFISYIPYPVTTGFTAGIALVIASLQLKDFLGLAPGALPEHFVGRLVALVHAVPTLNWPEAALGLATLAVLLVWARLRTPVPAYLVGATFAALAAYLLHQFFPALHIETIADRFHYELDGVSHPGIPRLPPHFLVPWDLPGPDGQPLELSFALVRELIGPAFAIALLGAIESLLCAVIADGMTGKRHDPDAELVAQGLGNLAAPLFGGIPATGALARTAANIRSGAVSPIASLIHALFVLAAMVTLAPLLSWLPMCGLAALLMLVAWNMSERHKFARILRTAPRGDVVLLLLCFGLTVGIDMVIAISVGVVLAALQFMHRMAKLSRIVQVHAAAPHAPAQLPPDVRWYAIAGPLFFGAAERAAAALRTHDRSAKAVILDLGEVPVIDATGLVALETVITELAGAGIFVALVRAPREVLGALRDSGFHKAEGKLWFYSSSDAALRALARRPAN